MTNATSSSAQKDNHILPWHVPCCSCSASVNYLAFCAHEQIAIVAGQLVSRELSQSARSRGPGAVQSRTLGNELQLAWVCTISAEHSSPTVLATSSMLYVLDGNRLVFYQTSSIFGDEIRPVVSNECILPADESFVVTADEGEAGCIQQLGPNKVLLKNSCGSLFLVTVVKDQSRPITVYGLVEEIRTPWRSTFFSIMPLAKSNKDGKDMHG